MCLVSISVTRKPPARLSLVGILEPVTLRLCIRMERLPLWTEAKISSFQVGRYVSQALDFPAVSHRDLNRMPRVLPLSKVSRKKIDSNVLVPNRLHVELASHPHVLEVSVVARLHSKWGERPMAFVILHPQHAAKWDGRHHEFGKDLKEHAKRCLPGFACPEWVEVVPELPVSRMT